jgi:hypothetical protein
LHLIRIALGAYLAAEVPNRLDIVHRGVSRGRK